MCVYLQLCPRVFSEEVVPEAISDGLLSAFIYPNSSPAGSRANFGYMYLSVMTRRRISIASNCNVYPPATRASHQVATFYLYMHMCVCV